MSTGRVTADITKYRYRVAPDYAIAQYIDGISVRKETLVIGQQVKIIQMGDGETSQKEFGFCSITSNLGAVISVPDNLRAQIIDQSPASFAAAFIANAAGKFLRLYELAKVKQVYAGQNLKVEYITGDMAGRQRALQVLDVDAGEFVVDEVALVDCFRVGRDVVSGWWEIIPGAAFLTLAWNVRKEHPEAESLVYDFGLMINATEYPAKDSAVIEFEKYDAVQLASIQDPIISGVAGKSTLRGEIAAFYEFEKWAGDVDSVADPYSMVISSDITVVATFLSYYALRFEHRNTLFTDYYGDVPVGYTYIITIDGQPIDGDAGERFKYSSGEIQFRFFEAGSALALGFNDDFYGFFTFWKWIRMNDDGSTTEFFDKDMPISLDTRLTYRIVTVPARYIYVPKTPTITVSGAGVADINGLYVWNGAEYEKGIYRIAFVSAFWKIFSGSTLYYRTITSEWNHIERNPGQWDAYEDFYLPNPTLTD